MSHFNIKKRNIELCLRKESDVVIVGLTMCFVFVYIMFEIGDCYSDLPAHAGFCIDMLLANRLFANNFLMYFLVNLTTGFLNNIFFKKVSLALLIAIANTVKYVLVRNEFHKCFSFRQSKAASVALLFVFVVPWAFFMRKVGLFENYYTIVPYEMYYGYYVPNVWHNSTIICMMPFAIVSFFLSVRQFDQYDGKRNGLITLFVVLGALVKPSFFFLYVVAYPICMFVRYRFDKPFFYSLLPILAGILCVLYEYMTIYCYDVPDGDGVSVDVMHVFSLEFLKSHYLYFLISMALPILFVILFKKDVRKDIEFWFVFIMLVVGLGISWCCSETGPRADHGNFGWQVITAMWFVYYYMLKKAMKRARNIVLGKTSRRINNTFLMLFGLHVLMGCFYLMKYLVTHNYA